MFFWDPILAQCWSTVWHTGPTLRQHWLNASCLLGYIYLAWVISLQVTDMQSDSLAGTIYIRCFNAVPSSTRLAQRQISISQQILNVHPASIHCWPTVCDGGPTLNRRCLSVSCLLQGYRSRRWLSTEREIRPGRAVLLEGRGILIRGVNTKKMGRIETTSNVTKIRLMVY